MVGRHENVVVVEAEEKGGCHGAGEEEGARSLGPRPQEYDGDDGCCQDDQVHEERLDLSQLDAEVTVRQLVQHADDRVHHQGDDGDNSESLHLEREYAIAHATHLVSVDSLGASNPPRPTCRISIPRRRSISSSEVVSSAPLSVPW